MSIDCPIKVQFTVLRAKHEQPVREWPLEAAVESVPNRNCFQKGRLVDRLQLGRSLEKGDFRKTRSFCEYFLPYLDSSFEKHIYKRNKDYGEPVSDKIKIAEAIITLGEVLSKF